MDVSNCIKNCFYLKRKSSRISSSLSKCHRLGIQAMYLILCKIHRFRVKVSVGSRELPFFFSSSFLQFPVFLGAVRPWPHHSPACASSSKAASSKGSTTVPNGTTNREPCVQIQETVGDNSNSNHHTHNKLKLNKQNKWKMS